jgi:hypothetical protein
MGVHWLKTGRVTLIFDISISRTGSRLPILPFDIPQTSLSNHFWASIMEDVDTPCQTTPLLITREEYVEKQGIMAGNIANKKIKECDNTMKTVIQSF